MKERKRRALKHYLKMIEWAKNQIKNDKIDPQKMDNEINECWGEKYCSYCRELLYCHLCELYKGNETHGCCNGLWQKMKESKTWGEWIINAEQVYKYIEEHG